MDAFLFLVSSKVMFASPRTSRQDDVWIEIRRVGIYVMRSAAAALRIPHFNQRSRVYEAGTVAKEGVMREEATLLRVSQRG